MTLAEFGQELRTARLERNVSLNDISAETRINQRFLEAIEAGQFAVLPQTYVRAFLREYAAAVGLLPDAILERYDAVAAGSSGAPAREAAPRSAGHPPRVPATASAEPSGAGRTSPARPRTEIPYLGPIVFGGIIVVGLALAYLLLRSGESAAPTTAPTEIPFDRVIRESEAALPAESLRTSVSPASTPGAGSPPALTRTDSLTLEMTTTDSVWINIVIDQARTEEYLFAPNRRRVWKAAERFSLTMGNAGGATFRLNGKDLGALGKRGAVLRNSVLTANLLR